MHIAQYAEREEPKSWVNFRTEAGKLNNLQGQKCFEGILSHYTPKPVDTCLRLLFIYLFIFLKVTKEHQT